MPTRFSGMRFVALVGCVACLTISFATDCIPQCSQCDDGKCAACNPGYTLDEDSYAYGGLGVAGGHEIWDVDTASGLGEQSCFEAVMKDARCNKDYFTYVARGDKNCGCKGDAGELHIRGGASDSEADYYKIKAGKGCVASCIGQPALPKPSKPATPFDLNGKEWPEMCVDASSAHFFGIGDWGGLGESGKTWTNPWKCKPSSTDDEAANLAAGALRPCQEADLWAQRYVARQMKIVANTSKPDYILNVGDNFYPGGVSTCEKNGRDGRWKQQFDKVYSDPNLDSAPWMSVLGNHDYGGIKFLAGWDHQIFETWNRENWVMPGQFWRRKVQYSDFAVEYFFLDSNLKDARTDPGHRICQGEGSCYNMTAENCPKTLDKVWSDGLIMLEEGLKASTAEWHIIVTHFPALTFTGDRFFQKMHQTYGIDLLVTGHTHFQQTGNSNGIQWILTGGGGGVTSDIPPQPNGADDAYGFVDFTINRTHIHYDMHSWGGLQENGNLLIRKQVDIKAHEKKPVATIQDIVV